MGRILFLKKILFFILIIITMHNFPAWGGDVVVIQSAGLAAYNAAWEGFTNVLLQDIPTRGPKAIRAHTISTYILTDIESPTQLRNAVIKQHPDLLLVVGSSSLALVKNITDIPIIYLMIPFPKLMVNAQDNITGINMNISVEQQLAPLLRVIPQIKSIGLLYDPKQTGMIVQEALEYARQKNISLLALPVKEPREVPGQLAKLSDKADCFWMLPDRTVLTPQTIDYLFLFSLENRIPILTFSEKYLAMGAVLSVSFDTFDMGRQAGELALKVMHGSKISDIPPERVREVVVHTNEAAAKMLGIVLQGPENRE